MGVDGQNNAPATLHPGKRHDMNCIGDWAGPKAGSDINKSIRFKIFSSVLSFEIIFPFVLKYVNVQ
jgi:hypothetical protein